MMVKRLQNKTQTKKAIGKGFCVLVLEIRNNALFGDYVLFDDATSFRV